MPFVFTTNLFEVRALAEKQAKMAGLPDDRVVDFVIAVSEVAGNTGGTAEARLRPESRERRDERVFSFLEERCHRQAT